LLIFNFKPVYEYSGVTFPKKVDTFGVFLLTE